MSNKNKNDVQIRPGKHKNSDIIDAVEGIQINLQNNIQQMSTSIAKAIKEAFQDLKQPQQVDDIYDYDNFEHPQMESENDQDKWNTNHDICNNKFNDIYEKYERINHDVNKLFTDRQELEKRLHIMTENTKHIYDKLRKLQDDRENNNKILAQDILLRKSVENCENKIKQQEHEINK